jgi:hypothetical protein
MHSIHFFFFILLLNNTDSTETIRAVTERCGQTFSISFTYHNRKKCPYQNVSKNICELQLEEYIYNKCSKCPLWDSMHAWSCVIMDCCICSKMPGQLQIVWQASRNKWFVFYLKSYTNGARKRITACNWQPVCSTYLLLPFPNISPCDQSNKLHFPHKSGNYEVTVKINNKYISQETISNTWCIQYDKIDMFIYIYIYIYYLQICL